MDKYKDLITGTGKHLVATGWEQKESTFYLLKDNNWLIIDFQKGKDISLDKKSFTFNLAISSTALRSFEQDDISQKPDLWTSHWKKRIGPLMPGKKDHLWVVGGSTDVPALINELTAALDKYAIPELSKYSSDASLENLWLKGRSPGLTDLERLTYLSTLLKLHNRKELDSVLQQLNDAAEDELQGSIIKMHIAALSRLTPKA